jgi:hypothetical protein
MKTPLIITIDYDKTINNSAFPVIGEYFLNSKEVINKWFDQGIYIIINTCRTGDSALCAEFDLLENGFHFHKFNEQHPYGLMKYGTQAQKDHNMTSRKIFSHINIDDTNINWVLEGHPGWDMLDQMVQKIVMRDFETFNIKPDFTDVTATKNLQNSH